MTSAIQNPERDRAICDMWNAGKKVSFIARRNGVSEGNVYRIAERRREQGWNVARRHSVEHVEKRNRKRWDALKRRALELETLANGGKIDPFARVNVKKASHIMGVSACTLYRGTKTGAIPHEREARAIKFRLCDLIDWAKSL